MSGLIFAATGFALGLYAGKRRANGRSWNDIGHEAWNTSADGMRTFYVKMAETFGRKKRSAGLHNEV